MREEGTFDRRPRRLTTPCRSTRGVIGLGVKMGEGWLLTAEMLELYEQGVHNIVCTQPFGCLPNHICGKGMMKPIKDRHPDINIVAIDYDAGATRVNQVNRLKLMLANAPQERACSRRGRAEAARNGKTAPCAFAVRAWSFFCPPGGPLRASEAARALLLSVCGSILDCCASGSRPPCRSAAAAP